ncbi:MAG: SAM-dependent methyltransferase [Clostridiales bacterium]|jgi:tRNA (adenine22-N1)-methyltransferase|nr:SAM-dependent methyltransferase [Clostridiales bacterium]
MQLSNRLQAVASLVTPNNRVADIGCDHAYTSIYLIENKLAPHVIAMDVNQGPIERARINIEKYGFGKDIETRKSNGLEKLKVGEVDTVLIAGMGGGLAVQILRAHLEVVKSLKELVLQPQSEIYLVRRLMEKIGFFITQENMIKEDGKYYVMMRAQRQDFVDDPRAYELKKEEHYHYGRLLLEGQHPILKEFLQKEFARCDNIIHKLRNESTSNSIMRLQEITQEKNLIELSLGCYNQ